MVEEQTTTDVNTEPAGTEAEQAPAPSKRHPKPRTVWAVGTVAQAMHKGGVYRGELVARENGKTAFVITEAPYDSGMRGREFSSPSAAAKAITNYSVSGFVFFHVVDAEEPAQEASA